MVLSGKYSINMHFNNEIIITYNIQACADVEIDEYQNYEKALGALSECLKCFEKVGGPKVEEKAEEIARNSQLISR